MATVSIGLPVFNGERYLQAALDSLLGQSFEDLELIIVDNASSDRTGDISRTAAKHDRRVRYIENRENLGAARNFNKAFQVAVSEYFKWAAHDDLCGPTFLEECIRRMQADRGIVLCHSQVALIDENGVQTGTHRLEAGAAESPSVHERFKAMIDLRHWCFDIFGVIRASALRGGALIQPYYGSDRNLLVDLALQGRFCRVDEFLFKSREHGDRSIRMARDARERTSWFDPSEGRRRVHPYWKHLWEYQRSVLRANIGMVDKARCSAEMVGWALRNRRYLVRDLIGDGALTHEMPNRR